MLPAKGCSVLKKALSYFNNCSKLQLQFKTLIIGSMLHSLVFSCWRDLLMRSYLFTEIIKNCRKLALAFSLAIVITTSLRETIVGFTLELASIM